MNHVNIIGKMTTKPRYYETPNGRTIARFTVATKETILDDTGNPTEITDWHRVTAWGNWVKVLQEFATTGMDLAVEGKLKTKYFAKNGIKNIISEVEANDIIII